MKLIIFLLFFAGFICSCNNNTKHPSKNTSQEKFDKAKWRIMEDKDYPYRDKMLNDLIAHITLKGLKRDKVIDLLGEPDRIDSSFLFYGVAATRVYLFPLHTKTLVIKLARDSTVEWRKIHE